MPVSPSLTGDTKAVVPATSKTDLPEVPIDAEYASSFSGMSAETIKALEEQKAGLAKTEAELAASKELSAKRIQQGYDITEEEILANRDEAQRQMKYAQERLGGVVLARNIEDFNAKVKNTFGGIDRSLERLQLEEVTALETNDMNYLDAVRNLKLDAIKSQQDMVKMQVDLYQAYSTELTAKQNRSIAWETNRRNRLDFQLDNNLIDVTDAADVKRAADETGYSPTEIRQAVQYRETLRLGTTNKTGIEYDKARKFIKDNPDADYEALRSGILEHTTLADTDVTALLESNGILKDSINLNEKQADSVAISLVKQLDVKGANEFLDAPNPKVKVNGKETQLSAKNIKAIRDAINRQYPEGRTTLQRWLPGGK